MNPQKLALGFMTKDSNCTKSIHHRDAEFTEIRSIFMKNFFSAPSAPPR